MPRSGNPPRGRYECGAGSAGCLPASGAARQRAHRWCARTRRVDIPKRPPAVRRATLRCPGDRSDNGADPAPWPPGASIAVCTAMASEYHGTVKTAGLLVPGVTVTAIQGDKKLVTTTDERGVFSFADLADGTWTIELEMLGFAKLTREVGVAHDAPAPELALKIMSEAALLASLEPSQAGPAADRPAAEPPAPQPPPVASPAASAAEIGR